LIQANSNLAFAQEDVTRLTEEKRSTEEQCLKAVRGHTNCSTTLADAIAAKDGLDKAFTETNEKKLASAKEVSTLGSQLRIVKADLQSLTLEHEYAQSELDQTRKLLADAKGQLLTQERTRQQQASAAELAAQDARAQADASEENYDQIRKQLREEKHKLRSKHDTEMEQAEEAHNATLDKARALAQQSLKST
jgi:hypothetical protein